MNSLAELLDNITPDIYQNLKRSVELGKWPNGDKLTVEQKQLCLQAMIAYEQKNLPEQQRTGYIETKKHTHCGSQSGEVVLGEDSSDDIQTLNLK